MDARITREETALLLNIDNPKETEVDRLRDQALRTREAAFGARLLAVLERTTSATRTVFAAIAGYAARRRTLSHLKGLSDRELADIGLSRNELGRVFDTDFATAREARPSDLHGEVQARAA